LIESPVLRVVLILGVVAAALLAFDHFRLSGRVENFAVTLCIVCLLLLPQTGNYYLVLLIPPLLLIFSRGGTLRRVGVLLIIVAPWLMRLLPDPSLEALLLPLYALLLWSPNLLNGGNNAA
jgi:hypothetical protein